MLPLFSSGNEQVRAWFKAGNEQYAKGKYQDAVLTYHKILNEGYFSSDLYFNLGNTYYKLEDIPSALLYYEKAYKLAPGDEDIKVNIQLANLKTIDKVESVPSFFLATWWKSFILYFSVNTLTVFSILFILSASVLLIVFLFAKAIFIKKCFFYLAISLLFFGVLSIFVMNRQVHYFASHTQAIIFTGAVTVKSEPESTSKSLFVIHKGTKVSIVDDQEEWMKIELPNGKVGWINTKDAQKI